MRADEQRRKDKKREKKEKKKEKKEKKDKIIQNQDNSDIVHGRIGEKLWPDAKVDYLHKGSSSEERSSLTEEHAKPVCLRVPSSSSDSTENSNKRKRPPSPVDVSRGHGKIIRIRLSSKKQNQPDANVDEQKHCSTSGRAQVPPQTDYDTSLRQRSEGFCSTSRSTTNNVGKGLVLKTGGERIHLATKKIDPARVFETISLPAVDPVLTPMQKEGLLYRNLIENWAPPRLQDGCADTADEDWLFGANNKAERSDKKSTCRDESMSYCNTSLLWPRAQYLPEVDIYALPYTLPF